MAWREVTKEKEWLELIPKQHQSFLWMWSWGKAQSARGKELKRLVYENTQGVPILLTQAYKQSSFSFLHYWLLPYGPVQITPHTVDELRTALQELRQVFFQAVFLRIEPRVDHFDSSFCIARKSYNPAVTRVINLTKDLEVLTSEMHSKTRYNARLAERHGVTVRLGSANDIDAYIALEEETAKRDGFTPLSATYVKALFQSLSVEGVIRLRMAEKDGRLLAASIEVISDDTVTYLFGASSNEHRELMAPFALHYSAILSAKAEGKHWYDLWGCNPEDDQDPAYKPSWKGITRFKSGWGGELVHYMGTWDLPIKPWLYKLIQLIRK